MAKKCRSIQTAFTAAIVVAILSVAWISQVQAQPEGVSVFAAGDKFAVPEQNGSVCFGTNGSYTSASFENGVWTFTDLTLYNSSVLGTLRASAKDSNVTIYMYASSTANLFGRGAYLLYLAEGKGEQTFNLGLNHSTSHYSWSIIVPFPDGAGSDFLAEGKNWKFQPDNTLTIYGVEGNITVVYFGFATVDTSNLPFYEQHSVALATAAVVAATVAIASVVSFRVRRRKDGGN